MPTLERAANAATYYSMQNGGQTCVSVERVYVEAPICDRFVDAVTEQVKALRVGPPNGPASVEVGAITFGSQLGTIATHVEQARGRRRITAGGQVREGRGASSRPTVLADVDHSMTAMTEETFRADGPDHEGRRRRGGDQLASDSPYGPGASVWTRTAPAASRSPGGSRAATRASTTPTSTTSPSSSRWAAGRSQASASATALTGSASTRASRRSLVRRFAPSASYFPYRARTTKLLGRLVKVLYGRGSRA